MGYLCRSLPTPYWLGISIPCRRIPFWTALCLLFTTDLGVHQPMFYFCYGLGNEYVNVLRQRISDLKRLSRCLQFTTDCELHHTAYQWSTPLYVSVSYIKDYKVGSSWYMIPQSRALCFIDMCWPWPCKCMMYIHCSTSRYDKSWIHHWALSGHLNECIIFSTMFYYITWESWRAPFGIILDICDVHWSVCEIHIPKLYNHIVSNHAHMCMMYIDLHTRYIYRS